MSRTFVSEVVISTQKEWILSFLIWFRIILWSPSLWGLFLVSIFFGFPFTLIFIPRWLWGLDHIHLSGKSSILVHFRRRTLLLGGFNCGMGMDWTYYTIHMRFNRWLSRISAGTQSMSDQVIQCSGLGIKQVQVLCTTNSLFLSNKTSHSHISGNRGKQGLCEPIS